MEAAASVVRSKYPWNAIKWTYITHAIPGQINSHTPERVNSDYVKALEKEIMPKYNKPFDFISVDGRERVACLKEAMKPGMLKTEYGIFMLDNSEREYYDGGVSAVPSHWLIVSFQHFFDETTIWMACPSETDENCARARKEIHETLAVVKEHVGKRYTDRMGQLPKSFTEYPEGKLLDITITNGPVPDRDRDMFGPMMDAIGLSGSGLEIGVADADFSYQMVKNWKGLTTYHLVDPWKHQGDSVYHSHTGKDGNNWEQDKQDLRFEGVKVREEWIC